MITRNFPTAAAIDDHSRVDENCTFIFRPEAQCTIHWSQTEGSTEVCSFLEVWETICFHSLPKVRSSLCCLCCVPLFSHHSHPHGVKLFLISNSGSHAFRLELAKVLRSFVVIAFLFLYKAVFLCFVYSKSGVTMERKNTEREGSILKLRFISLKEL